MVSEAQLGLLLGGGAIYHFVRVWGGSPPLSEIFQKQKCFFNLGFEVEKKEIFKNCCTRIWLCLIQVDFICYITTVRGKNTF